MTKPSAEMAEGRETRIVRALLLPLFARRLDGSDAMVGMTWLVVSSAEAERDLQLRDSAGF